MRIGRWEEGGKKMEVKRGGWKKKIRRGRWDGGRGSGMKKS
jgi:hypothetical protein